ncbi:lamin tail domain-containing protein [Myxococcus eversor]|uniref:lamin tail domain-containing protein n=1 Tax=Myxococcus eversor TaxID=2709661 RepID=UPI0013D63B46|nr:lamin tail domain-containing protein [Myxococcus eversor]
MQKRNWLAALMTAVLVTLGTGCGDECVDQFDCRADNGQPDQGKEWTCNDGTCEQVTINIPTPDSGTPDSGTPDSGTPDSGTPDSGTPDAGVTCNPACAAGELCDVSSGAGVCKTCRDSATGAGTDEGCSSVAPVCDTAGAGGKGVCTACRDSATGNGQDLGCSATTPVCDAAANNGVGVCKACTDSATGNGQDLGCSATAPLCDTTANSGAGACKVCVDSLTSPDLGCSSPTNICDTAANNGAGECKVCNATEGCQGEQTCNATGTACEGCADNASCAPETPVCRTDTTPTTCVECTPGDTTHCDATKPACNANFLCGCTDNGQCAGVAGSERDFCDLTGNNGRGQCEVCVTDAQCAGVDPAKAVCNNRTECVQCLTNANCSAGQVCNTTTHACETAPGPTAAETSAQITAFLAAANDATNLPVEGAYVTALKPAVQGQAASEPVGFFLQAEPNGPAMFVSDATALGQVAVGDRVSLTVALKELVSQQDLAKTVTGLTRISQGHSVNSLAVDRSAAEDLITALDTYEYELVTLSGTLGVGGSLGTGFTGFAITTVGMPATNAIRLRFPSAISQALDAAQGCQFNFTGPMWRFGTTPQPSVTSASDITLDCPAPKLLTATAVSATEARLTFDRKIDAASAQASDFTIANLTISGVAVDGVLVTLTTSEQTAGTAYTATVSGEVTDLGGKPVNPANNSANFNGFTPPPQGASLVINEVDYDNIGTDNAEFIEIYNRGDAAADLSDLVLVLVNGDSTATPRREYLKAALSTVTDASGTAVTSLPAGGYLVAASTNFFTANPLPGVLRLVIAGSGGAQNDIVQNGFGDGVGLIQNSTGTMVDTVFYETPAQNPQNPVFNILLTGGAGEVTLSFVEGTRTVAADSNSVAGSLQRVPNGGDTNDNNADFAFLPISPGAATP